MKCRHHVPALLHPYRIAAIVRQYSDPGADSPDDGRADKDCLDIVILGADVGHVAVKLPAIGVTLHADVEQAKAGLSGMSHLASQKNGAGAGAEDRFVCPELL